MLRIMAGMAQKDSCAAGVAGILAGFARYAAPRAVFPLFLGSAGRRILAILAEEVQAALVVDNSGMFMVGFARDDALRAVFLGSLHAPVACAWLVFLVTLPSRCILFDCRQARVAGHHGVPGQGCSLPVCATTRLMVQTVQMYGFLQFLDKVGDSPVAPVESTGAFLRRGYGHFDRCRGPDSENCLEVLQLLFIEGRRHPRLCAEADPHGPGWSENHRDSPVHRHGGRFPCCAGRTGSQGQVVDETVVLPQFLLVEKIVARRKLQLPQLQFFMVVHISVVAQRQVPMVLRTMALPQLHVDKVFDVPVSQVV